MADQHEGAAADLDAYEHTRTIVEIDDLVARLQGPGGRPTSRERSLAVTKLQEAAMWLIEDARRSGPVLLGKTMPQELRESVQRRPERDVRAVTCGEARGTLCYRPAGHVGQCVVDVDGLARLLKDA